MTDQKQKKQKILSIRDLINKRVKITYFYRDSTNTRKERSVFDRDVSVEGVLVYYSHYVKSKDPFPYNGSVSTTACIQDDNGKTHFEFLPLDGSLIYNGYMGKMPSKFDGKRNGSYIIELLEKDNE